jgi:hypothetical protein
MAAYVLVPVCPLTGIVQRGRPAPFGHLCRYPLLMYLDPRIIYQNTFAFLFYTRLQAFDSMAIHCKTVGSLKCLFILTCPWKMQVSLQG